ncbi:MAG: ATPase, partial [Burkholderiales bacterium]|nr:ATPase [Burkholderiales bacterium]
MDAKPCDIASVIYSVCARQQELAETHNITCDLYSLPATVIADEGALDQMLTNLLSNAVKYSPDSPEIHVRASREGSDIILQVRDSGLG